MSQVHGVIVLARNGDRHEYYQNPNNYAGGFTETTPLGEVQSHQLGNILRSEYFSKDSSSSILGMNTDLVDTHQVHVLVKAGGEGTVVFDSAIATLQGLFPPNPSNKMTLANDTTVIAPLGGYQYVPVETVEPSNDRSLESWTDCPAFERHIEAFHNSEEFKKKAEDAKPFLKAVKDYVFGRPTTLENIWNIYDFVNSELEHNQSYAYRLPPTYKEQAQGFVNFHENGLFHDKELGRIGNIAGRTILSPILRSLERIAFNGDPLQFLLIESTYQPFISLMHMAELVNGHPELEGVPDYGSALAIELRRGAPPAHRDFLRFKFKNGTSGFETLHAFGHHGDIPLTEFIYRTENYAIGSNREWENACNSQYTPFGILGKSAANVQSIGTGVIAFFFLLGLLIFSKLVRRHRANKAEGRLRLPGQEYTQVPTVDGKDRPIGRLV
ncbi:hypothetical protein PILCRDRAFT_610663 [Piloderma croceum F 1598]|uniref:Phosphoglycerate mutase-like protein n=1 Tax=Piloderma croceum (strain F 1598) TaxID=765440 RepID=A0A0C3BKH0_PILCF|nr:hypothetical protein PILCRDRAFT_610663 [Piloderma croceum F 1598]